MELNVHKLTVEEAIEEIIFKFEECVEVGDSALKIIHGHKHGTRIRDRIRSNGFLKKTSRIGYKIVSKNYSDDGVTIYKFEPSQKSVKIKSKTSFKGIKTENRLSTNICIKCKVPLIKESNWYKCPKCRKLKKW